MHKNIYNLIDNILQYEDIPNRLKVLKDTYKDETCYIVSAGTSENN